MHPPTSPVMDGAEQVERHTAWLPATQTACDEPGLIARLLIIATLSLLTMFGARCASDNTGRAPLDARANPEDEVAALIASMTQSMRVRGRGCPSSYCCHRDPRERIEAQATLERLRAQIAELEAQIADKRARLGLGH
jgi:hypothetical protein